MGLKEDIKKLKSEIGAVIAAHYYQQDEIVECADIIGDSLELAKKCKEHDADIVVFCGVSFMGESVKILAPQKKVYMPTLSSCSMADMIGATAFDNAVAYLKNHNITEICPVVYINSSAAVKAKVGDMGGYVCTSANASKIVQKALSGGKKVLFCPDRCLGANIANAMGLQSCVIGDGTDLNQADIICYDGFCSVHQLFCLEDIRFYRDKYPEIKIIVHPECDPSVVNQADFVGSTSKIIDYVNTLDVNQKIAVGTEFNLVNRLRKENTFVLSSTKPQCVSMSETNMLNLKELLLALKANKPFNEISVEQQVADSAFLALDRMFGV